MASVDSSQNTAATLAGGVSKTENLGDGEQLRIIKVTQVGIEQWRSQKIIRGCKLRLTAKLRYFFEAIERSLEAF